MSMNVYLRKEHFIVSASAIVLRDGEYAIAVDGKTKRVIARSTNHKSVINSAVRHVYNNYGRGNVLLIGEFEVKGEDGLGIELYSNIALEGIGEGTVIKNRLSNPGNNYLITNVNRFSDVEYDQNIQLRNLVVDYDKYCPTSPYYPMVLFSNAKGILVENVKFRNHKGEGGWSLGFQACEDVVVRDVVVEASNEPVFINSAYYGGSGITLGEGSDRALTRGVRHAIIEGCIVRGTIDDAILAGAGAYSYDIKVVNCIIDKSNGYSGSGISVYGSKLVRIIGNTIKGGPDASAIGLRLDGTEDVIIEANTIEVNVPETSTLAYRGKAISIPQPASKVKILNNIIVGDFYDHTIIINSASKYVEIRGNYIEVLSRQTTGQTIRITSSASKIKVVGNKIIDLNSNTNYNILLDSTVSDIEIKENDLEECDPSSKNLVINGSNIIVIGNKFNSAKAIHIAGGTYTISRNIGYPTENSGVTSITGDGSTTEFTVDVAHGLVSDKVAAHVTTTKPTTATPSYIYAYLVDKDSDGFKETLRITVRFDTAPGSGEVVEIYWRAVVVA